MELYIPNEPFKYNKLNGRFLKGNVPHNKGKKWEDYMDMRKAKRIKRIAMQNLKPNMNIGGWNKKQVIGIKEGRIVGVFESSISAANTHSIIARNIRHCCEGKRKRCGGIYWFWEEDYDRWSKYLDKE